MPHRQRTRGRAWAASSWAASSWAGSNRIGSTTLPARAASAASRAVALGLLDQLGQACQRIVTLQERRQGCGRDAAALGLGKQQVECDRAGARRLEPRDQVRHQAAAPGPATDLGEARIVDQHQHDLARGRLRRPRLEAKVQQLPLELLDDAELTCRQIDDRRRERRQQCYAEGGQAQIRGEHPPMLQRRARGMEGAWPGRTGHCRARPGNPALFPTCWQAAPAFSPAPKRRMVGSRASPEDTTGTEIMRFDLLIKGGEVVDPGAGQQRQAGCGDQARPDRGRRRRHPRGIGLSRRRRRRPVRDARPGRSAHARLSRRHLLGHPRRSGGRAQRRHHLARCRFGRRLQLARVSRVHRQTVHGAHLCAAQHLVDRADRADLRARQPRLLRRRPLLQADRPEPGPRARHQGAHRSQHHARHRHRAAAARPGGRRPVRGAADGPHRLGAARRWPRSCATCGRATS